MGEVSQNIHRRSETSHIFGISTPQKNSRKNDHPFLSLTKRVWYYISGVEFLNEVSDNRFFRSFKRGETRWLRKPGRLFFTHCIFDEQNRFFKWVGKKALTVARVAGLSHHSRHFFLFFKAPSFSMEIVFVIKVISIHFFEYHLKPSS